MWVFFINFFFPTDGVGYCLGDPDGDCWYLYTLQGPRYITGNKYDKRNQCEGDQTLEILMTDLDPKVMNIFTKKHSASAPEATKVILLLPVY